jgi:hypothetical protein
MTTGKVATISGTLANTAVLVYGFTVGDFAAGGAGLLANPWGIVSMVDLYTDFILFSAWIVFREENNRAAVVWVAAMMGLNFFTGSLYALFPLFRSAGDWRKFWIGRRE